MEYKFILMRHAQSKHNQQKNKIKSQYPDKQYKKLPFFKGLKYNANLIDSDQVNVKQIELTRSQFIDLSKIQLIIVSPLRRCLKTCQLLIQSLPSIPVVVEPLLNSRLDSAWSIGSHADLLKSQYPAFNFDAFNGRQKNWMLEFIDSVDWSTINLECEEQVKQHLLKELESGKCQSFRRFYQRSLKLKEKLKNHLLKQRILSKNQNKQNKQNNQSQIHKQVLIIAHSCVLKTLVGTEFDQNGKVIKNCNFQHCTPVYFKQQSLPFFNITELGAKL